MSERRFLSTGQASRLLGVSDTYVRDRCVAGRIEGAYQLPSGHWRVPREWPQSLLEARRATSKGNPRRS